MQRKLLLRGWVKLFDTIFFFNITDPAQELEIQNTKFVQIASSNDLLRTPETKPPSTQTPTAIKEEIITETATSQTTEIIAETTELITEIPKLTTTLKATEKPTETPSTETSTNAQKTITETQTETVTEVPTVTEIVTTDATKVPEVTTVTDVTKIPEVTTIEIVTKIPSIVTETAAAISTTDIPKEQTTFETQTDLITKSKMEATTMDSIENDNIFKALSDVKSSVIDSIDQILAEIEDDRKDSTTITNSIEDSANAESVQSFINTTSANMLEFQAKVATLASNLNDKVTTTDSSDSTTFEIVTEVVNARDTEIPIVFKEDGVAITDDPLPTTEEPTTKLEMSVIRETSSVSMQTKQEQSSTIETFVTTEQSATTELSTEESLEVSSTEVNESTDRILITPSEDLTPPDVSSEEIDESTTVGGFESVAKNVVRSEDDFPIIKEIFTTEFPEKFTTIQYVETTQKPGVALNTSAKADFSLEIEMDALDGIETSTIQDVGKFFSVYP